METHAGVTGVSPKRFRCSLSEVEISIYFSQEFKFRVKRGNSLADFKGSVLWLSFSCYWKIHGWLCGVQMNSWRVRKLEIFRKSKSRRSCHFSGEDERIWTCNKLGFMTEFRFNRRRKWFVVGSALSSGISETVWWCFRHGSWFCRNGRVSAGCSLCFDLNVKVEFWMLCRFGLGPLLDLSRLIERQ